MNSLLEIFGGSFGFLMLLIGLIFFSFIGLTSLPEVFGFDISRWEYEKTTKLEKIKSLILTLFSFTLVYYFGRTLIEFFI